jgi:lipoprotein-releasing system permease protein
MFKPLEVYIGLRYTRAKRRNHFISFISFISILGLVIGVTALITVLSVMNGFDRELHDRILAFASDAVITGYNGKLEGWREVAEEARHQPHVLGAAPYVQGEAMLTRGQSVHGTIIRGVLPSEERTVSEFGRYMVQGSLDALQDGSYGIVLGAEIARAMGVNVGDKVTMVAPQMNVTPAGIVPRLRRFTVVGVFEAGYAQYDTGLALINLDDAQRLFRMEGEVSGLRIKVDDVNEAPRISRELARDLGGRFWVRDWTQQHVNFFRALKTEKTVMFIILTLIVAVAAFNIVSTLIMVVTDKQADIAILRTLGATPRSVMGIFMVQGTVIGLLGTVLGVLGGIALATNVPTIVPWIEALFHTKFLSPDVYYISEVPSDMRWTDVGTIAAVSFALSVVGTIYPAWRASRVQPAQALRYE